MKLLLLLTAVVFSTALGETVVSRVTGALETDALSPDEAVFILYYSVYDMTKVPAQFSEGAVSEPCGTPAFDLIVSLYDRCSAPVRNELDILLARPYPGEPYYTTISPNDYFKIHWTTAGANATNENYVNILATAFDTSWETLCNTLGFNTPPSDMGLGGCDRYDVYIMSLTGQTLGYCSTSGEVPDPTTPNNDWSSHIAMSNNESYGHNQMIETSAHEFKHAIQNAYDTAEPTWFKENCATWAQNVVFDTNLYTDYLKSGENCLRRPWYDIRSGQMYWYGATPWPMYMQYRTGGSIAAVKRVWENCAAVYGANLMDAIETTAGEYGFTFIDWLAEYTAWRWFTGARADDDHYPYEECSLWGPGAYVFTFHNVTSLPASLDNGVYPPETYGNHWIQVNVEPYQGWITVNFDGRDYFNWILGVIRTRNDGTDDYMWTIVDNDNATYEWGIETVGWDRVIIYPQSITVTTLQSLYQMDITFSTGIEEEGNQNQPFRIEAGSNPFSGSGVLSVTMPESGYTTISVYNTAGRMVQTVSSGELPQGQSVVNWNASELENGTYFVRLTGPGGGVTARVTVLN